MHLGAGVLGDKNPKLLCEKAKKELFLEGGTRGHPEMSLACPVNSGFPSSSLSEGVRVQNMKLPSGQGEGWRTPDTRKLV